jgi:putative hydroxymethylpyrimidine transport system permease protein
MISETPVFCDGGLFMIKKHSDKVIPAVFIGALLLIWELCVRIFRIPLYVPPSLVSVVQALIEERVGLWGHAVVTTEEALIGIGIALILSLALGVLMDYFPAVRQGLYPILVVTQTVPMIVMAPILIIYMGFGMLPKIFTVVLMCFFPVAVSFVDGLGRVDSEYVHLVRSYERRKR